MLGMGGTGRLRLFAEVFQSPALDLSSGILGHAWDPGRDSRSGSVSQAKTFAINSRNPANRASTTWSIKEKYTHHHTGGWMPGSDGPAIKHHTTMEYPMGTAPVAP